MSDAVAEKKRKQRKQHDPEQRAARVAARRLIHEELRTNKKLPKQFIEAIKLMVPQKPVREANSIYTRIIDFICGKEIAGVKVEPPKKGFKVDDFTLFKIFKVNHQTVRQAIYLAQESGIWVDYEKNGEDYNYWLAAEQDQEPDGYSVPARRTRKSKNDDDDYNGNGNDDD